MANEHTGTIKNQTAASGGIAQSFGQLADGVGRLMSEHLALARIELNEEARALGVHAAHVAIGVPFLLVGYALLCVAAAVFLTRFMALDLALLAVGGANLAAGAVALWRAVRRLRARPLFSGTFDELRSTSTLFSTTVPPAPRLGRGHGG